MVGAVVVLGVLVGGVVVFDVVGMGTVVGGRAVVVPQLKLSHEITLPS